MEFFENDESLGRIPSYRSIQFTRVRHIKHSRINSTCEFCNDHIHIGDSCHYWSGIDLGKFFYYRVCQSCSQ